MATPSDRGPSRFDRAAQRPGKPTADSRGGDRRPDDRGGDRPPRHRDEAGQRDRRPPNDRGYVPGPRRSFDPAAAHGHAPHADRDRDRDRAQRNDAPPADWVTGAHAALALLQSAPQRVLEVWLWSRDPRLRAQVHEAAKQARVAVHDREPPAFDDPANPQGVAVRVTEFRYAELDQIAPPDGCAAPTLILVLDSITDPRNLGAILRSASFFAAQGVIIPQDRAAGITPLVERISRGATATVPVVRVVNLARTLQILQERGVFVVGTGLEPLSRDLAGYAFAPITAIVLGAEGDGIRPLVRKRCDEIVKLSGSSQMQSLNVSAFATLILHTARAQLGPPS